MGWTGWEGLGRFRGDGAMTRSLVAFICVLLGVPLAGSAQDLTIDELVATALERSPVLKAARTGLDVARGQLTGAELRPNPMFGLSRQEMFDGPDNQTMVEVQWPLGLFRRSSRAASAKQEVDVTSFSIADRERLVVAAIREQAGDVLEARRTLGILDEVAATTRQVRDLMEARVREGAARRLELDILRVEVQRADAQVALQTARVEAALIRLRALAGLEPEGSATLRGDLEDVVRSAPVLEPKTGSSRIENRADVREATSRVNLATARLQEAQREGWVDASVVGEYGRMNASFPQRAFDDDGGLVPIQGLFNNLRIGVVVTVPIFDRNQGHVATATADRQRAEHEVTASRLAAVTEVAVAEARERGARRAVELYGSDAREQARRNLDVVREAYQLGSIPLVEVLSEQRRYLDVETAYTQALLEAYQARTAVRRATGEVR
jgi:cobalt-zinc-cadmium efflux system outer membrane protein